MASVLPATTAAELRPRGCPQGCIGPAAALPEIARARRRVGLRTRPTSPSVTTGSTSPTAAVGRCRGVCTVTPGIRCCPSAPLTPVAVNTSLTRSGKEAAAPCPTVDSEAGASSAIKRPSDCGVCTGTKPAGSDAALNASCQPSGDNGGVNGRLVEGSTRARSKLVSTGPHTDVTPSTV